MAKRGKTGKSNIKPGTDAGAHYEHRVEVVLDMLRKGKRKGEIKKELKNRFGIEFRRAEDYITEAKNRMTLEVLRAKDELRGEAYGYYKAITEDESVPVRERIRAREAMDKLLGLQAPIKIATTDTKGNDQPTQSSAGDRIVALVGRLVESGRIGRNGGSASGGGARGLPSPPEK